MSNDLISRREVLDIIKRHECDTSRIILGVTDLPTAYDVDKIVKQIETERKEAEEYNQSSAMIAHEIDIEIVKSGGIK